MAGMEPVRLCWDRKADGLCSGLRKGVSRADETGDEGCLLAEARSVCIMGGLVRNAGDAAEGPAIGIAGASPFSRCVRNSEPIESDMTGEKVP